MGKKIDRQKYQIQFEGVYDLHGMYLMLINYYKQHEWDYSEVRWKEKPSSPIGNEVEVTMNPSKKVDEYYMYHHNVFWENLDAHAVTVMENGKPVERTHGRLRFILHGAIEIDWQDLGDGNERLKAFVTKYVTKREFEVEHLSRFRKEMNVYMDKIKAFLGFEVFRDNKEGGI